MSAVSGRIVLAQETRFRLVDDEGRDQLFLLSHKAGIEPEDLSRLQREQTRVRVEYSHGPGMVAMVADAIHAKD
jgi:hypothetical protein